MKLKNKTWIIFGTFLSIAVTIPVAASVLEGVGIGQEQVYSKFLFSLTEYIGECTGTTDYSSFSGVKLWIPHNLVGNTIPEPKKGRRVRIINRSNGGSYTDREWQKPPSKYLNFMESEGFKMGIARSQDNSLLALTIGKNDLIAVFYEGKFNKDNFKELATAEFSVQARSETQTKTVNRQLSDPIIECAEKPSITDSNITPENCPGNRQQVQYFGCPSWTSGGAPRERRIIATLPGSQQQEQRGDDDNIDRVFRITNQTGRDIKSLYISSSNSDNWGSDALRRYILPDGKYINFRFHKDKCYYDIKAVLTDGRMKQVRQVNTCEDIGYTFR